MEDQLIRDISKYDLNTLEKLSSYFKENDIVSEQYNDFKETLLYFIKNKFPENCVQYLMNIQKDKTNHIEALFYSLEQKNFEIIELLLKNNVNMFKKIKNKKNRNGYTNILEYCGKDMDSIKYILSKPQASPKLITSEYLCGLIVENNITLIDYYFNYKFRNNGKSYPYLLNHFIINGYKTQRALNNNQIVELMNELNRSGPVIDLNKRNYSSTFPLMLAVGNNNAKIVKLILNYAERVNYPLNINQKSKKGYTPFYTAVRNNFFEITNLLLEYSIRNSIKIEYSDITQLFLTEIFKFGSVDKKFDKYAECFYYYPYNKAEREIFYRLKASIPHWYKAIQSVINYAKKFQIELNLNFTDDHGQYPISTLINFLSKSYYYGCYDELTKIIQLLIDYAEHQHIILKFLYRNYDGNDVLQELEDRNPKIAKLLSDYVERNPIILDSNSYTYI